MEYSDIYDKEKGVNFGISANANMAITNVYNESEPNNPNKQLKISKSGSANYDAVDREQINRATIGAGTIIVDGKEVKTNINRDESKSQELTKDISVEKIAFNYDENRRKWNEIPIIMGEYGLALGKDLDTAIGKVSEKDYKLEEKLGQEFHKGYKGVENFIDYKLGNKLIGIIPTEDTNGGVAGELQSPSSLLN